MWTLRLFGPVLSTPQLTLESAGCCCAGKAVSSALSSLSSRLDFYPSNYTFFFYYYYLSVAMDIIISPDIVDTSSVT